MTEQQQQVIDAFTQRGFTIYQPEDIRERLTRLVGDDVIDGAIRGGFDFEQSSRCLLNHDLPNGMRMIVHESDGSGIPLSMESPAVIALWPFEHAEPFTWSLSTVTIALAFVDALIESGGNINTAHAAGCDAGAAWEEEVQSRARVPRNEQERVMIEEFAKHGYVVKQLGLVRGFVRDFDGGWHGITVAIDDNAGDLPQTMGQRVSAAFHVHGEGTHAVFIPNSRIAIRVAEGAIKVFEDVKASGNAMTLDEIHERSLVLAEQIKADERAYASEGDVAANVS